MHFNKLVKDNMRKLSQIISDSLAHVADPIALEEI